MSDTDTIFAQKQTIAKLRHRMDETLVTHYDEILELKGQLAELRKMLAEMHEVNAELHKEIAELQKDKERLDWLLDENSCTHIERGCYNRVGNWLGKKFHNRSDIDREMEEL